MTVVRTSEHGRVGFLSQETVPALPCSLVGTTVCRSFCACRRESAGQPQQAVWMKAGLRGGDVICGAVVNGAWQRTSLAIACGECTWQTAVSDSCRVTHRVAGFDRSATHHGQPAHLAVDSLLQPHFALMAAESGISRAPAGCHPHALKLISNSSLSKGAAVLAPPALGEAVISDWSAYSIRHMSSVTGNSSVKCITAMEGQPMPTRPRLATRAVEESIDTQVATRRVTQIMTEAMADGVVTLDEARAMLAAARQAEIEADEAAQAAEHADISELLAVAHLTGEHSPRLLSRAQAAGLPVVMVSPNLPRQSDDDDHPRAA